MGREYTFEIKQALIHYNPDELEKWRQGDPAVVPPNVLEWKGPGRQNGYGYSEHVVMRHLTGQGFQVIVNAYNLFPVKKSKFHINNAIIQEAIGIERYARLQKAFGVVISQRLRIEHPDTCIYQPELFFAEVKRDWDRLRQPQIMFAAVVSAVLNIPFWLYRVLPVGASPDTSPISIRQELPEEVFVV